jgi:hypothetical protein
MYADQYPLLSGVITGADHTGKAAINVLKRLLLKGILLQQY